MSAASPCLSATGKPKLRFLSRDAAMVQMRRPAPPSKTREAVPREVYHCAECGFWHIGKVWQDRARA